MVVEPVMVWSWSSSCLFERFQCSTPFNYCGKHGSHYSSLSLIPKTDKDQRSFAETPMQDNRYIYIYSHITSRHVKSPHLTLHHIRSRYITWNQTTSNDIWYMCIYIHVLSHTSTYVIRLYHWGALVPDLALRGSAFIRWESWITKMFTLDHRSRLSWGDGWWKWLSFCMIAADCFLHQHLRDFLASPLLLMCSYLCPTKAMSFASKTKPGHARTTVQVTLMVWWISRTACRIMEHHATIQFSKSWHSVLKKHTCTERQPGISVPSQVNGWHMLAHVGTC